MSNIHSREVLYSFCTAFQLTLACSTAPHCTATQPHIASGHPQPALGHFQSSENSVIQPAHAHQQFQNKGALSNTAQAQKAGTWGFIHHRQRPLQSLNPGELWLSSLSSGLLFGQSEASQNAWSVLQCACHKFYLEGNATYVALPLRLVHH